MIRCVPSKKCEIIVTANQWGREFRSPEAERRVCEGIKSSILRHVDHIGEAWIKQSYEWKLEDGSRFETLYEALQHLYKDEEEGSPIIHYRYRYVRPSDEGVGTRCCTESFRKVIEDAWNCPHEFELLSDSLPLGPVQEEFLNRVISESLKRFTK